MSKMTWIGPIPKHDEELKKILNDTFRQGIRILEELEKPVKKDNENEDCLNEQ